MDLIRFSIRNPVTILSGIIMVLLFGLLSLTQLPYQMSPTVVEPEITVETTWRGASPYEVEREIIEEQENALKGLQNLVEMESDSQNSRGTVTLRFKVGTDVNEALLRVSNKLDEVPSYPDAVDKPIVKASGASASPVVWMILKTLPGNERPVNTYRTFFENNVRQHLERVEGVSDLFFPAGTAEEMHVVVDPGKLAAHGLTIGDVIRTLQTENVNIPAGTLGVGRWDYRIRTTAEFKSEQDIADVVLRSTGQKRVRVRDVAEVVRGYAKISGVVLQNGTPGLALGVRPEPDVNILDMTNALEERVEWLNKNILEPNGVFFNWVYDQRFYIGSSIDLIKQNIMFGGLLAIFVLLLFLRSVRATVVVGLAIPISIIGTFILLNLMGRNLNVVSMAGIAFAVGMLVDNAIVVIENIDRHRKMGKSAFAASYEGTREVWGAVLASTITTLAVFLPVVFIEEEAGQLFRDIAIAVVAAVTLSLFVSVSVIPMFANKLFAAAPKARKHGQSVAEFGNRLAEGMMTLVTLATRDWKTRSLTVILLISLAIGSVVAFMPKKEYLPQGNRNFVLSILIPPPGLSDDERLAIGHRFFEMAMPHIGAEKDGMPAIRNMFFVARDSFMIVGALAEEWDRARELLPLFNRMIQSIPGMYGITQQPGIFQRNIGRGRTVEVDVSGDDLDKIVQASGVLFGELRQSIQGAQVRPVPSIELTYPEARYIPDRDRLEANGLSAADFGVALDVLMDGADIGDYKEEGKKKIDLVLLAPAVEGSTPEDLFRAVIATPQGKIVPISSLARMEKSTGVAQIRHLEQKRTITLQVTPPTEMPLEEAMEVIDEETLPPLRDQGLFEGLEVRLAGTADKLKVTAQVLAWDFVLAAVIAYLLMASLFGNFVYPLIIMLTVPLAGAGGFVGLQLLNLYLWVLGEPAQAMDILTMLGFIILIGVVVNNAILIVHQALNNFHEGGMDYREAVLESTRSRLRPIYMSATTSIFGMLPLVLVPGAGAEMYRGLGSVLLGGLGVSTIFTVFVIPAILMWVIRMEKRQEGEG